MTDKALALAYDVQEHSAWPYMAACNAVQTIFNTPDHRNGYFVAYQNCTDIDYFPTEQALERLMFFFRQAKVGYVIYLRHGGTSFRVEENKW